MWRAITRCALVVLTVGACSESQPLGPYGGAGGARPQDIEQDVSQRGESFDGKERIEQDDVDVGGRETKNPDSPSAEVGGRTSDGAIAQGVRVLDDAMASTGGTTGWGGVLDHPMGGEAQAAEGLLWPIDCLPFETCTSLRFPDIDDDGVAHDCGSPGYQGHQGTDIGITWEQMDAGVAVRAAADGIVFFAADGKYDHCPSDTEPDCQPSEDFSPGDQTGTNVCTESGPYCGAGGGNCYWCFAGGNVIVLLHQNVPGVFATRYDHLKRGSLLVKPGDLVTAGQVIGLVGSAGKSTGPHLHFEVWGNGYYQLSEPWAGPCGPNHGPSLWAHDPPWQQPMIR